MSTTQAPLQKTNNSVLQTKHTADYLVGTLLKATAKDNHYFMTSMGGIWRDEAEEVN